MKLEEFILKQLYILGAVGIGIAFLQVKHNPLKKIQVQHRFKSLLKHMCFSTLWPSHYWLMFVFVCFPASGDNFYLLSLSKFGRRSLLIPEFYILKKGTWIRNCSDILILSYLDSCITFLKSVLLQLHQFYSHIAAGQHWFSVSTRFT